ncbi:MAG: hypothetical protein Q4F13_14155 [Pseudomonadota bacterium]|nr:hypothetical protein [Pseudomonadota bacterium]
MNPPPFRLWRCAPWLLLYAALLYAQAATASLTDAYLPGIERLRWLAGPGWVLLGVLGLAWLSPRARLASLAVWVCAGAALLCAALAAWLIWWDAPGRAANTWLPPQARSWGSVLHVALAQPSFSNRSLGAILGSGLWALAACALAAWLARRPCPLPSSRDCQPKRPFALYLKGF